MEGASTLVEARNERRGKRFFQQLSTPKKRRKVKPKASCAPMQKVFGKKWQKIQKKEKAFPFVPKTLPVCILAPALLGVAHPCLKKR
jgi:hypothetical protein